ncbi:hypothetical protein N9383_06215 [Granulosicoccus sp.]|nr:hypothetical protein [Granulosicoccus sp.]
MTGTPSKKSSKAKLREYLTDLKEKANAGKLQKLTTAQMAKEVGIPRSTLYKYHKSEISEFKKIVSSSTSSSSKRLLQAARRENRILRERNEILTSIAHEYFIENETLKANILSLKNQQIVRIK